MPTQITPAAGPVAVAHSEDVAEGGRYVVALSDSLHIGIFRFRGKLYAYENTCPHQVSMAMKKSPVVARSRSPRVAR